MKTWGVYATVRGSRYLGEVEAKTEKEAQKKADKLAEEADTGLCHECAEKAEDLTIHDVTVEEQA